MCRNLLLLGDPFEQLVNSYLDNRSRKLAARLGSGMRSGFSRLTAFVKKHRRTGSHVLEGMRRGGDILVVRVRVVYCTAIQWCPVRRCRRYVVRMGCLNCSEHAQQLLSNSYPIDEDRKTGSCALQDMSWSPSGQCAMIILLTSW